MTVRRQDVMSHFVCGCVYCMQPFAYPESESLSLSQSSFALLLYRSTPLLPPTLLHCLLLSMTLPLFHVLASGVEELGTARRQSVSTELE
jgi:hypothetical protein